MTRRACQILVILNLFAFFRMPAYMPVFAQTSAVQITTSGADARANFGLDKPLELTVVSSEMAPAVIVVGADALGRFDLTGMGRSLSPIQSTAESSLSQASSDTSPSLVVVQVTNADAIGRFGLRSFDVARTDVTDNKESPISVEGASLSSLRIQVTGADAIGNFSLQPRDRSDIGNTRVNDTLVTSPNTGPSTETARVQTDGKLNVRSGPDLQFDVVGQLDGGENVTVLTKSDDGEWLLIMTGDGLTGWVSAQFMAFE